MNDSIGCLVVCLIIIASILIVNYAENSEGGSTYREEHGQVKSYIETYDITSIRVDDDAEYHITAISRTSRRVLSIHDAKSNGYVGDEIRISYCCTSTPILEVKFSDKLKAGEFIEVREASIVRLPTGYKIDTFSD